MRKRSLAVVLFGISLISGIAQTDTTPPTILSAANYGTSTVQVNFSEPVDPASATALANYAFTNGVTIYSAALNANTQSVTLRTSFLAYGSNYTLVVSGVQDLATPPNVIAPNSAVTFTALIYSPQDVGSAVSRGTIRTNGNGYDVTAGGAGLAATTDQFSLDYQMITGDFDLQARVQGLTCADAWTEAGLMAREALANNARFAAVIATPSLAGTCFTYRAVPGVAMQTSGSFPANFPNGWLRLARAGNQFTGFASYDGRTWTLLGTVSLAISNTLYVGMAVTSHNTNQAVTAQFRDLTNTVSYTVGAQPNTDEPLGPSSRLTGLVISEIMYKPAPRADGLNCEFVEIFNSNPFFHDISGHQLAGDIGYTFPPNTIIPGGGMVVVAAAPAALQSVYGITNVFGPYTNSLKKSGTVKLIDEIGQVLLKIDYASAPPWPVAADGAGHSLVLARPSYGENDPRAWDISDVVGGSPGVVEAYRPNPLRNVVINEFLAHTDPPLYDYIELYNHSTNDTDLSGCVLTDDATNNKFVIAAGTKIPARGYLVFYETELGFRLNAVGETIYFKNPDGSRVLDAVAFEGQANGVSMGRYPNGACEFYPMSGRTPGLANRSILVRDIVINELMYKPISGDDNDQFIELFNQGANAINVGGWQFTSGVSYTFPSNTIIAANGYLVVAKKQSQLFAHYPNLSTANTVGDFSGSLSGQGERLALSMPDQVVNTNTPGVTTTNTAWIVEDEVTYHAGGRWPKWAHGGGSSMELIDPRSNHRLAQNWADSDETAKAAWTNIETTGVLDLGANISGSLDCVQVGLLDEGECVVDNIEVIPAGGSANYVANPDFESGLANWSLLGDHSRSSLDTGGAGYLSANALHLRASDGLWVGLNEAQGTLANQSLASGQTATLRFKARWLRGWPEVMARLHGNWLEAAGRMSIPSNLGTPGARNTAFATNAGPALYDVSHSPALPAYNQPVVVTARAQDPDGPLNLTLYYRIDPGTNYIALAMMDDGTAGDAVGGDGLFTATLPAQNSAKSMEFFIASADGLGATNRFPALVNDNAPIRECVVRIGDATPVSAFGAYHLWLSKTNLNRWNALPMLSNELIDGTLVYFNRVIYNMGGRYSGSPYHQYYNGPDGSAAAHMDWAMPEDDQLLGTTSFNKIHWPGNDIQNDGGSNSADPTLQREQAANTFLRGLGLPWVYRRYVIVYVDGSRRGKLMEDARVPNADFIKSAFPNDPNGFCYKIQPWFEFAAGSSGSSWANESWSYLYKYLTTGGAKKLAWYRWTFQIRQTPDSDNDYTNLFSLIDATTAYNNPNYPAILSGLVDTENWMRLVAANHAAGNWDCVGYDSGQNVYAYMGPNTRWSLLMFDFSIVLGDPLSYLPTSANLYDAYDSTWSAMYSKTFLRRQYLRAIQELVNGPMSAAKLNPLVEAKYNAFTASGISATSPSGIESWVSSARNTLLGIVNSSEIHSFTLQTAPSAYPDFVALSGSAPLTITSILVNGLPRNVTWTGLTSWSIIMPLALGTNTFTVVGLDRFGNQVSGASNQVAYVGVTNPASPAGALAINEIMYNPAVPDAGYVELLNTATDHRLDLSGLKVNGLGYAFPAGSYIEAGGALVLAKNRSAFANAYGATIPVFDLYSGNLQNDGETLSLLQPGLASAPDTLIDRVRYESLPPWPTNANGAGASVQLIDATNDHSRAGNWTSAAPSPRVANPIRANLPAFPTLWLNEVQADNLAGPTDNFGERDPWVELYNPGADPVSLDGLYLANDYNNLTQWAFPAGVVLNPGQCLIAWCDGQPAQTSGANLHTGFRLAGGSGSIALARLVNAAPQVVDYLNYKNLQVNHSYGDVPDGQPFFRQTMAFATPGQTNSAALPPLQVYINEWMAWNANPGGYPNPIDNKYSDWFELYNAGTNTADLSGYYLTDTLTNWSQYHIPSGYGIPPHGFLLVWANNTTSQNTPGNPDLHTNFKMSKSGEALGLFAPDGTLIDAVTYGAQTSNTSQGHYPDGAGPLHYMTNATPGQPNVIPPPPAPVFNGITPDHGALSLSFSMTPDRTYRVEYKDDLGAATWQPYAPDQTATTTTVTVAIDPAVTQQRFYRVVILE